MSYQYFNAEPTHATSYLWPFLQREISVRNWPPAKRAFDLGCGNGTTAKMLSTMGFEVIGVDTSETGVRHAQASFPDIRIEMGSAYDSLGEKFGTFDLVVSLEVIEHCIDPRAFARTFLSLIKPGGIGVLSTPYHGYLKNVLLAISGKMDAHFTALWDGGHVKFFSIRTMRQLLVECGAQDMRFERVGRIPPLAKSMIAIVSKKAP